MEMYGYTAAELFGIDDLVDLSNDHIFTTSSDNNTYEICVPNDQVAQLEWLSNFAYADFPVTNSSQSQAPFHISKTSLTTQQANSSSHPRRCTHCASEKTPQWRTGPLGPKTLCNACGVRYKSGRLVPGYRPAASPTFVLTQHSNSHRKVMELRRQKHEQDAATGHHRNYQLC